jgi:hypothetical protein
MKEKKKTIRRLTSVLNLSDVALGQTFTQEEDHVILLRE